MPGSIRELDLFAKEALSRGLDRASIGNAMTEAGWSSEQAQTALDAYADVAFPIPIPRPRPQLSAREAFLYLLLFTTLYLTCYHLGSLAFDLINRALPDSADRFNVAFVRNSTRWAVAYLIIAFPVFLFLARHIAAEVARQPVKRLSPVRRWLTYLTLLIASGTLLGDLIALVYSVLAGELTMRISLKVLVVLVIAGTALGYYLSDLRREEQE